MANRIVINGNGEDPNQVMENGQIVLEKLGTISWWCWRKDINGEIIFDRTDPDTGEKVEVKIPIEQTLPCKPLACYC